MTPDLQIILWPDPRLLRVSEPVVRFDDELRALTVRMFELMREARGVGLAAPQVGQNIRLFVMSATGKPEDDRVYVNPVLTEAMGEETDEEGCLSLPDIRADIARSASLKMHAQDIHGKPFEEIQSGYIARIWQHEFDHLNGVLLTNRMGLTDQMKYRKKLREMESEWLAAHPLPKKLTPRAPARRKRT